ncbi:MAG: gliding motility-associated C-terminal domain-containing protein [Bacteroidetes bacterium]|nr:gliding motility-associated C-terminal domain-containing protein [Bacteroidota bacterium]
MRTGLLHLLTHKYSIVPIILIAFFTGAGFFIQPNPVSAQSFILLFQENFDDVSDSVTLNTTCTGNNSWVVNNQFSGQGVYPDVPIQDSTVGGIGQIGAGTGNYLHISNSNSSVQNASYNPNSASVCQSEIGSYCTLGYTRIVLQFWMIGSGSPADYCTISSNTGVSVQLGPSAGWQFIQIEDPSFIDRTDLTFYITWTNDAINTNDGLSIGIDDIMIVAYYDPFTSVQVKVTNVSPNPMCHEELDDFRLDFQISGKSCPGNYELEISDANCNFNNSTPLGIFSLPGTNGTVNYYAILSDYGIRIPTTLPFGNCYCFRLNRITPPTAEGLVATPPICLEIIDCTDSTRAYQPTVTADPYYNANDSCNPPGLPAGQQEVCIYSVIDVPFLSFGAFNPGNNYVLELSDSSGSFSNPQVIGGPMPDTRTWDPALGYLPPPPGSISGQIPIVPPGCNYYIRVTATNPLVDDTVPGSINDSIWFSGLWGPFCIKECDIKTNNAQDITLCITNTEGACDTIRIDINSFDSTIFYNSDNEFIVQLLSPSLCPPFDFPPSDNFHPVPMEIVSEGELGIYPDTASGDFLLCVPPIPDYLAIADHLGMHYMRIIATSSSDSCNLKGSIIRLTVNGISGTVPELFIDPVYIQCGDENLNSVTFTILNPVPSSVGSIYILNITGFVPIEWDVNQWGSSISLGFPPVSGVYTVTIQEQSKDGQCKGPKSVEQKIVIDLIPDVRINGPVKICFPTIVTYSANFEESTFYEWNVDWPPITGFGEILVYGNNEITLGIYKPGTFSINLVAQNECDQTGNTITVSAFPKTIANAWPDDTVCKGESVTLFAENTVFPADNTFIWILNNDTIFSNYVEVGYDSIQQVISAEGVYYVIVNDECSDTDSVAIWVKPIPELTIPPVHLCIGDSGQLSPSYLNGVSYQWQPGLWIDDNTRPDPTVYPIISLDYSLVVYYDSLCEPVSDTTSVTVTGNPVADAGQDVTSFQDIGVTLTATGGFQYLWSPPGGLSDPAASNPFADPDSTVTYFVTVTDAYGCTAMDSVKVTVIPSSFEPGIPGGFTPNGDGVNDEFKILDRVGREGMAVEQFDFKIFDRWGELIFETDDVNKGWDGTHYKNGKKLEVGVYVWLLTAESVKGEKFGPMSGNVSLLR